jgi:thiopeptide-type bacteriocin biosynthesis protein
LTIPDPNDYEVVSALDAGWLSAWAALVKDPPAAQADAPLGLNDTLHLVRGEWRYLATTCEGLLEKFELAAVRDSPYLRRVVEAAGQGVTVGGCVSLLATMLAAPAAPSQRDHDEAAAFVTDLCANGILKDDATWSQSGLPPQHGMYRALKRRPATREPAARLRSTMRALAIADDAVPHATLGQYRRALAKSVEGAAPPKLSTALNVSLWKPCADLSIGPAVQAEIVSVLHVLHQIGFVPHQTLLKHFVERFRARYGDAEVPLLEAVDTECGIDLSDPLTTDGRGTWGQERERHLQKLVYQANRRHDAVLIFDDDDVAKLSSNPSVPPPESLHFVGSLLAASAQDVDRGRFKLIVRAFAGPGGLRMLTRFCHGNKELRRLVRAQAALEQHARPGVILAEVVHSAAPKADTIFSRPVLRCFDIPILGRSEQPPGRTIKLDDLYLSVVDQRIRLVSRRLNREVVARVTTAHGYSTSKCAPYRFLAALQEQGVSPFLRWDWGRWDTSPYLPRIEYGRSILSKAQWRIDAPADWQRRSLGERCAWLGEYQCGNAVPDTVLLLDGEEGFFLDFRNWVSRLVAARQMSSQGHILLSEVLADAAGPVRDRTSVFLHEVVVPLLRDPPAVPAGMVAPAGSNVHAATEAVPRAEAVQPPGSRWLYLNLYGGARDLERCLVRLHHEILGPAIASQHADKWFFIRYDDGEKHVRLRVSGEPQSLWERVWPSLRPRLQQFAQAGEIWRLVVDTYVPEVHRYGGVRAIGLSEVVFHADSEAAVSLLKEPPKVAPWLIALKGLDAFLDDFRFPLAERMSILKSWHDEKPRSDARHELLTKTRSVAAFIQELSAGRHHAVVDAFAERSRRAAAAIRDLWALEHGGALETPLRTVVVSFMHMHCNRVLRHWTVHEELMITSTLLKHYRSLLARGGNVEPRTE